MPGTMIVLGLNGDPEVGFSFKYDIPGLKKGPRSYCMNLNFTYLLLETQCLNDEILVFQNDHFLLFSGSDFKLYLLF